LAKLNEDGCNECGKDATSLDNVCSNTSKFIINSLTNVFVYLPTDTTANDYLLKISEMYEKNNLVYIGIDHPDHHFVILKDQDSEFIQLYQSYIGEYKLIAWMSHYNDNKITFNDFFANLSSVLGNNVVQKTRAFQKLFLTKDYLSQNMKVIEEPEVPTVITNVGYGEVTLNRVYDVKCHAHQRRKLKRKH